MDSCDIELRYWCDDCMASVEASLHLDRHLPMEEYDTRKDAMIAVYMYELFHHMGIPGFEPGVVNRCVDSFNQIYVNQDVD